MTNRSAVPTQFQPQSDHATERQLNYILALLSQKELPDNPQRGTSEQRENVARTKAEQQLANTHVHWGTKKQASDTISWLLSLPNKPTQVDRVVAADPAPAQYADVPAGRYAIERDGVLKFYRVDKPTDGRWAGYTFVKAQASDELYDIRHTDTKRAILAEIAKDPHEAMKRYGQELGHCGVCGRTLTDETSREIGIGPVCRENGGF